MKYVAVSILDKDDHELGLYSLSTNLGEMVILFRDEGNLTEFLARVRKLGFSKTSSLTRRAKKFGRREVEGTEIDDLRCAIVSTNPALENAKFITDQSETFADLMEGLGAPETNVSTTDTEVETDSKFSVIVYLDEDLKPTSLASVTTSGGPFVILFRNREKSLRALDSLSNWMESQPQHLRRSMGVLSLEQDSFDDAVKYIRDNDPSLRGNVTFIADDDQIFETMFASLS